MPPVSTGGGRCFAPPPVRGRLNSAAARSFAITGPRLPICGSRMIVFSCGVHPGGTFSREHGRMFYTITGIIILVLDIIAIVSVLQSSATPVAKLLWILLILLLPLIGMILYFLLGPGKRLAV